MFENNVCAPPRSLQALHTFINMHAIKPVLGTLGSYPKDQSTVDNTNIINTSMKLTAEQLVNLLEPSILAGSFNGNLLVLDTFCASWEPSIIPFHTTYHYCFYDLNVFRVWVICNENIEHPVSRHLLVL